jgi:hypothetical protein
MTERISAAKGNWGRQGSRDAPAHLGVLPIPQEEHHLRDDRAAGYGLDGDEYHA